MKRNITIKILIVFLIITGSYLYGCIPYKQVAYSSSPDSSKQILLAYNVFGDAEVILEDRKSGKKHKLFDITFSDDNERIQKFMWSSDGEKMGWLIVNSNRYPKGKRFIVFDLKEFPVRVKTVLDLKEDVINFDFPNKKITYKLSDGQVLTYGR
jgi:hypothetical protein